MLKKSDKLQRKIKIVNCITVIHCQIWNKIKKTLLWRRKRVLLSYSGLAQKHVSSLSNLHWPILLLFYAFFIQWSVIARKTIFLKWLTGSEDRLKMYLWAKINFCAKRASKIIVLSKEMLLSFSTGTFLTNYDVINRKLYVL